MSHWKYPTTKVHESLIPHAGRGLFAAGNIARGTVIGTYVAKDIVYDPDREEMDDLPIKLFRVSKGGSLACGLIMI